MQVSSDSGESGAAEQSGICERPPERIWRLAVNGLLDSTRQVT
jgi:hypothetical protein